LIEDKKWSAPQKIRGESNSAFNQITAGGGVARNGSCCLMPRENIFPTTDSGFFDGVALRNCLLSQIDLGIGGRLKNQ